MWFQQSIDLLLKINKIRIHFCLAKFPSRKSEKYEFAFCKYIRSIGNENPLEIIAHCSLATGTPGGGNRCTLGYSSSLEEERVN